MTISACKLSVIPLSFLLAAGAFAANPSKSSSKKAVRHETLIWSDEFSVVAASSAPDPQNWTYDTGRNAFGNHELETYCAYGSASGPCDPKNPNAYVGTDGYLHIVARHPSSGVYTSARLKSQGLQSFQYGRLEARIKMPAGQGFWPAFWTLGDNIKSKPWPACGEIDIMESVGKLPFTNVGSIHGPGFTGTRISTPYTLPNHARFADAFHTFGILWSPKKISFYVDDPKNIYVTYTPANLSPGAVWPFENGKVFFLLNLAVGGDWPGPPDAGTVFPQEMLVDYVRVYAEPASRK